MNVYQIDFTGEDGVKALNSSRNYCFPCYNRWLPFSIDKQKTTRSLAGFRIVYRDSSITILIKSIDDVSSNIQICFTEETGNEISSCVKGVLELVNRKWGYKVISTIIRQDDKLVSTLEKCQFAKKAILKDHLYLDCEYKNVIYLSWAES